MAPHPGRSSHDIGNYGQTILDNSTFAELSGGEKHVICELAEAQLSWFNRSNARALNPNVAVMPSGSAMTLLVLQITKEPPMYRSIERAIMEAS
jgi:hypothetical protein